MAEHQRAALPPDGSLPGPVPPTLSQPADDQVSLLNNPGELTDDTPTIISRNHPRPTHSEEPVGSLRGRQLAHFELIEPIGVGGMAAVLRARDTQLDRFVALKILPPEMAADAENVRRFHQEARSAAKLDHENIARVFFCGEDQRLHFIAFEFVEGENLRTILERRGRLPVQEALRYLIQVAAGLAHASRRGVVHRDIKPSNIIITPNERAKLVDMGLARTLEPHGSNDLTQSGVTLGTFDYISPEQALEPREADVRSDIYSLGCTFYHMLTGNPPVPEGTAAKKLHHHQHVSPTDPRLLVPGLPDEVAIILDRMMAKNPRDRYQSPEQLVQHLLFVARKLNVSADVPEGVLSIEASLPTPPTGRPLLLAAIGALAVIGLVVWLDHSAPQPAPPPISPHVPSPEKTTSTASPSPSPGSPVQTQPTTPRSLVKPQQKVAVFARPQTTAEELVSWLRSETSDDIEIRLSGVVDLSPRDPARAEQGLLVRNRKRVRIVPADPKKPPVVLFRYDGSTSHYDEPGRGARAALTFENVERVMLEGIRFQVDATGAAAPMAAVWLRGGKGHSLKGCDFVQAMPLFDERKRMASLLVDAVVPAVENTALEPQAPGVVLEDSCFLGFRSAGAGSESEEQERWLFNGVESGGQDAVVCRGALQMTVRSCAFGPHRAAFRVEPLPGQGGKPQLQLAHCSLRMGRRSVVFFLADNAEAGIHMSRSLVAASTGSFGGDESETTLLRQPVHGETSLFEGQENRYFNLTSYVQVGETLEAATLASLETVWGRKVSEKDSLELRDPPWLVPLASLENSPMDGKLLWKAFQVHASQPELRFQRGGQDGLAGAERVGGLSYTDRLPAVDPAAPAAPRKLVVAPGAPYSEEGVFPTLSMAINMARPGDVILIQHNGEMKLDPISLSRANLGDLTIKAARSCRPVLVLGNTEAPDPFLFRVHGGKLLLEHLELRLQPGSGDFKSQCVLSLTGTGQCTLRSCVITLEQGETSVPLAVAILSDAGKQGVKGDLVPARSAELGPRVEMVNCLVRGSGDLLWARVSRPAELDLENSLCVLGGSLLNVDAAREETSAAVGQMLIRLDHVTSYLARPLLSVRTTRALKYLTQVQCRPSSCLFLTPPEGECALLQLEGPSAEEKGLLDKVQWLPGHNAYAAFSSMVAQVSGDSMMKMPLPFSLERWKSFSGEPEARYDARLAASLGDAPFSKVLPTQLSPEQSLTEYGAQHINQLPLPRR